MKKSGGKFTRSHTTVIEAAEKVVDFGSKHPLITKISLGLIKPIKASTEYRAKCVVFPACILVHVRGKKAIQEIRFFSSNNLIVEKDIKKFLSTQNFIIT